MPTFEQVLNDYGKAIEKDKPFPALLGAYINGAFRIIVPTNPALAYVRHLDNTPATAYHHNRVDLTLDPTLAANQNTSIALYFDEYDHLAIWGPEPAQAGAILQSDPNAGAGGVKAVIAGTNVTVDNTDPTRPIVTSTASGGGSNKDLFTQTADQTISNTVTETTVFSTGAGTLTLPANWFAVGRGLEIELGGQLTTIAVLPGTLTFTFYLGGILCVQTDPISLTGGLLNTAWGAHLVLICRTIGASATVFTNGVFRTPIDTLTANLAGANGGNGSPLDSTTTLAIDVTAQFSVADPGNQLLCNVAFVRYIDPA